MSRLAEQDDLPAVISISYGGCGGEETLGPSKELCNVVSETICQIFFCIYYFIVVGSPVNYLPSTIRLVNYRLVVHHFLLLLEMLEPETLEEVEHVDNTVILFQAIVLTVSNITNDRSIIISVQYRWSDLNLYYFVAVCFLCTTNNLKTPSIGRLSIILYYPQ